MTSAVAEVDRPLVLRLAMTLVAAQTWMRPWEGLDDAGRERMLGVAELALRGIREPSPEMLEHGGNEILCYERGYSDSSEYAAKVWRAMVSAALSEGGS